MGNESGLPDAIESGLSRSGEHPLPLFKRPKGKAKRLDKRETKK
jgi:hypothetical protein